MAVSLQILFYHFWIHLSHDLPGIAAPGYVLVISCSDEARQLVIRFVSCFLYSKIYLADGCHEDTVQVQTF